MRSACLYVNARSRSGRAWFEEAQGELVRQGFHVTEALAGKVGALREKVRLAVGRKEERIILGGGDGTFSALAPLLAGSQTTLGILPSGTGNALSRDLEIPGDLSGACSVIATGTVRTIDMGFVGDHHFLNVATIGLSTEIARQLDPKAKRVLGKAAYAIALLKGLSVIRPFHVELVLDGETHSFRSLQVVIGNGRFHGGPFLLAPEADIDTGYLEVYGLASDKKWALWNLAWKLLRGSQYQLDNVVARRVRGGYIATQPSQRVTADGERGPLTPVRFGIRPGALRVYAPAQNGPKSAGKGSDGNEGDL